MEASEANKVKRDLPIMVVCGNPPYAGLSVNMNDWIDQLLKKKLPGENGAQSYYEVDGQPLGEKKLWLQDDYVKFILFGQLRIEQNGYGILAFITNHGYLDNPTFRGMRQSLMQTFDEIYLLDLHGNSKKKETCPDGSPDKNVFDIQQGVAIGIFVKKTHTRTPAKVYHADLYGLRKGKYEWLSENDIKSTGWTELSPNSPYYFFVKRDESKRKEYEKFIQITDIFPVSITGIVTARDKFVIDFNAETLLHRIKEFSDSTISDGEIRARYFKGKGSSKYPDGDTRSWKLNEARKKVRNDKNWKKRIEKYLYRPFDERVIYYAEWMVDWARPEIMRHMLVGENLGIVFMRQVALEESYTHFGVTRYLIDNRAFYSNKGIMSLAPLYFYPQSEEDDLFEHTRWSAGKGGRVPNLSLEFVEEFAEKIKLEFVSDGVGDLKGTFGSEDVFHYIYAVFHSPEYRRRYAEFLKIDFPRVPMPKSKQPFRKLCKVGEKLTKLHLMEAEVLHSADKRVFFGVEGNKVVERGYPKYVAHADSPSNGKVYINKDQYFEGVRPEVWEFHIGGYQVCEKWLKDRRGRKLSYDDISHYQKIVVVLGETIRLMKEPCLSEMFE